LLDVPILFEVGDEVVHSPMVDVRIGGTMTRLILDTGATDHVLTIELARAVGLSAEPGEPGTDHVGDSVPSWDLGAVPIQIGDRVLALEDLVAIAGPAPFEGWGVGGILSPQHLHPTAYVVIDLAVSRLILVEGDEGPVMSWLAARSPSLVPLSLARVAGELEVVVPAAIDPFAAVATMLNTGGRATEFAEAAVPGLRGTGLHSTGHAVGGGAVLGAAVEGQTLRVGDAKLSVPRLIVREAMGSAQGLIGMDILGGTVIMVSADRSRPVSWLIPRSSGPHRERVGAA
jgi:Retroviral aspartyl protease.